MSEIKVNKISPKQTCTTVTLGDSGDTFVIPSGVTITNNGTQTGFGRTGTVDWDTTAKTANFTAVSGNGYFVNTTSGAITVSLPAGSANSIVAVSDYASTAQTNNIIIAPNGTDKINGVNASYYINTQGLAVTLVYVDATKGWKSVTGSDADSTGVVPAFVAATGGTVSTCGDYKLHIFTGPGTFTVTCAGNAAGSSTVNYNVVAGGGGGGGRIGGGGGAGGLRLGSSLPVTATGYPITVGGGGGGGIAGSTKGTNGSNSIFSSITSTGGGGGGSFLANNPLLFGNPGGSGGGGSSTGSPGGPTPAGTGNTPPVSPPQGNPGGLGYEQGSCAVYPCSAVPAGGGGGASAAGENFDASVPAGAPYDNARGGDGLDVSPSFPGFTLPNSGVYAGGGGAGSYAGIPTVLSPGAGGAGGGGTGIAGTAGPVGGNGTTNTGGGGGGAADGPPGPGTQGGSGGSGIVMIRYKYQ